MRARAPLSNAVQCSLHALNPNELLVAFVAFVGAPLYARPKVAVAVQNVTAFVLGHPANHKFYD